MGVVEQSIVVACDLEQARDAWQKFAYKNKVGRGRGPQGEIGLGAEEAFANEEYILFEETGSGSTRVTLRAEYDPEEEGVDVTELRADISDEVERFRQFAERRMAA
jgi:hypothetical protein